MALFLKHAVRGASVAGSQARLLSTSAASFEKFKLLQEYKTHRGDELPDLPPMETEATKEECMKYFREMYTIRRMETTAGELYRARHIRGFCHLSSGQEAVSTGVTSVLRDFDSIITAYRCHGWAHSLGWSVKAIMAELFGNSAGASLGKGGSMHYYGERFYGGNGIVGAQIPVGAGIALKHKYSGDGGVCFALYGDGASNQGQVFEAYNMAKLWKLPVVFVCENNKYGMGTHDYRSSANTKYYTRGDYIPGLWVDGQDVLAVRDAARWAIEYANSTGPLVMEIETYRYHGHSMSDPDTTYRSRDDIKRMRQNFDPVTLLRDRIIAAGWQTDEEIKAIEKELRAEVKRETDEALAAPPTPPDHLVTHIYDQEKVKQVRGCDPFTFYDEL